MKAILVTLIALMSISYTKTGTAPICAFDGHHMDCFYYSWDDCESSRLDDQRCVANPRR